VSVAAPPRPTRTLPCLPCLQIGYSVEGKWKTSTVAVPADVGCVVFVPNSQGKLQGAGHGLGEGDAEGSGDTKTALARGILPSTIPRADAVFNLSRVALIVNAFATGDLSVLDVACQDALHQVCGWR
jgi:hypothetical protein